MKKFGFEAYIKEVSVKSLVTGDKSVRVTLQIDSPKKGLAGKLDELHDATKPVAVALAEIEQ